MEKPADGVAERLAFVGRRVAEFVQGTPQAEAEAVPPRHTGAEPTPLNVVAKIVLGQDR